MILKSRSDREANKRALTKTNWQRNKNRILTFNNPRLFMPVLVGFHAYYHNAMKKLKKGENIVPISPQRQK